MKPNKTKPIKAENLPEEMKKQIEEAGSLLLEGITGIKAHPQGQKSTRSGKNQKQL